MTGNYRSVATNFTGIVKVGIPQIPTEVPKRVSLDAQAKSGVMFPYVSARCSSTNLCYPVIVMQHYLRQSLRNLNDETKFKMSEISSKIV